MAETIESESVENVFGNGDVKRDEETKKEAYRDQRTFNMEQLKSRSKKLQEDILTNFNYEVERLFDSFVSEVDNFDQYHQTNSYSFISTKKSKKRDRGELPDKVFITRRSVLTELFEISHIQTIYHIFVAILILFSLNTFVYDLIDTGRLNLNFDLIRWGFAKFPKVMSLWGCMQLYTIMVYPAFCYWAHNRKPGLPGWNDYVWLAIFASYQLAFMILPMKYVSDNGLPPASTIVITTEQVRLVMKVHAFVRTNIPRVLDFKKNDDVSPDRNEDSSSDSDEDWIVPDFSNYLYFLFAPTLIYRDSYPRTPTIRWNYVVSNFAQVLACLFYTYYIFERFCVPVFHGFSGAHITLRKFILSVFGCMLPGTLILFIGFFAILHSWLNAFAEMLRFGDRLFYKDWWNSTTFSNYYRTWNVVVHDWLYTYIYKDFYKLLGVKKRGIAMAFVFIISAVVHEYILTIALGFFFPVLFLMFAGAGFAFIFLTDKGVSRKWNVFMWTALFIGNGLLMCLYSQEYYARQNCPPSTDNFLDVLIPRSWNCNFNGTENES